MEPDFGSFRRQSEQSSLDSVISLPELRYDVMARYPGYQVESSDPAPTKPTSLGLANFQQAKPAKEASLPLSPSIEAWLICQAQAIEGKDRLVKAIKAPLGPKAYPKLPSLKAERFEPSNAPSLLRVGQLPPDWHRLVADQGKISPETISFTRAEFSELQSSVSKMLAVLSDLDWWVAGVSNLAKDIQPHLSQDENLQLAGVYSQIYLLESCRSMEELEIQVTSLFSQFKLRERDGYLSRLNPHVPLATRRELRVSPLVGEYLFDEVLVSQAGDRLQGDVSLKSNTIMLDTLAKKTQGPRARILPPLKRPAPASTPLVSLKKPKQNPQPMGRGRGKFYSFYSRLFLVRKATGEWRPIIDLSSLNVFVHCPSFTMETPRSILRALQQGQWLTSLDLKDAYFHIGIHPADRRYLRFCHNDTSWQFTVLPFGLSTSPRVFTKILKPVLAYAHLHRVKLHMYLDDWLLNPGTHQEAHEQTSWLRSLCQS